MLSLFPQILFLAPAGITLLRVAAALCFVYMLWFFWQEKERMSEMHGVPVVGHLHSWMILFGEIVIGIIAILLLVGAWTQGVAILAALVVLKQLIFFRRYHGIFPFARSTYWLLLCICLMLVVTGAGAFAFDLPL